MRRRHIASIAATLALSCARPALASQKPSPPVDTARPAAASLHVSVLTIGQGDAIWELFAHNMIRIRDDVARTDISYNWGVFDFDATFIFKFARGRLNYSLEAYQTSDVIPFYKKMNRSIWEQDLALTPEQAAELQRFVQWNERPENKFYLYNYFLDNCSTRVRDALDKVLGGVLRAKTDTVRTTTTYRWHSRRLTQSRALSYTGITIGLGQPTDRPISAWQEMFLPVRMMEYLRLIRVPSPLGSTPLVSAERTIYTSTRPPEPTAPKSTLMWYLAVGVILGAIIIALARASASAADGTRARRVLVGVVTIWSALAGVAGLGLLYLWFGSLHVTSASNENVLQFEPLSLVLGFSVATLARWRLGLEAESQRVRVARALAFTVAGLSVLGFVAKLLPVFFQANGEVIALAMPIHVAVAMSLARPAPRVRQPSFQ